jgi:uncharacterized DUF497 family protein
MNLVIDELIIEDDRPEHIRKHGVTVDEVIEVVSGSYVFFKGKFDRWVLIGQSEQGKFLTIVVGERETPTAFGLVTARPSHITERRFYNKIVEQELEAEGGETHNDENNAA